jgi:hypothetical protein
MKVTRYLFVFVALVMYSCNNSTADQVVHLEGYWDIEKVVLEDGSEKEFPFSNHMDFFNIEGSNGTKHRVSPRYDGTMVDYGSPVSFKWEDQDGTLVLLFKDGDQSYKQTVSSCTADQLVLLHENGTKYYYLPHTTDEK